MLTLHLNFEPIYGIFRTTESEAVGTDHGSGMDYAARSYAASVVYFMAAQAGVAGSAKIGSGCMIGGQVGIAGHIKIGDHVSLGAQSGVHASIADGNTLMGTPAVDARKFMRNPITVPRVVAFTFSARASIIGSPSTSTRWNL